MKRTVFHLLAAALLGVAACSVNAADPPGGRGYGPGYGPGYGAGPGMMWGGGGYGMMGPGGYGMGGPGMMGGGGWSSLPSDLTPEQRGKITEIQREFRKQQWPLMQQMQEAMWDSGSGAWDEPAERREYERVASLHKQMFENMLASRKRMEAVLTPQQREQLRGAR